MTLLDLPRPDTDEAPAPGRTWSWTSGPHEAVNHTFRLRVEPSGDFRRVLEPLIAPFKARAELRPGPVRWYEVVRAEEGSLPYTLMCDGSLLASGKHVGDLTQMLAWHINHSVIQTALPEYVLLHAAAAVRGGVTVILPADQECGKSTTVSGLLREGFDYVTDEAVAINPVTGWITPFPKTLSLDPGSWSMFPECRPTLEFDRTTQWQVPVHRLGARFARAAVPPPQVIVFPKYVAGSSTTLTKLSPAEAVRELAVTSFEFPQYAGRNLRTLGRVAARATNARLIIGSLEGAIRAIETLVSERLLEEL